MPIAANRSRLPYWLRRQRWAAVLRNKFRRPIPATQTERNIQYLCIEVVFAAVLSAAGAFNATFAVRLGATNTMIGWLSSLPALLAMLLLLPSARLLETKSNRAPWLWGSLFLARAGYLLIIMVPWVMVTHRAEAVVFLLIAQGLPANVFNAGFNPMFADVVPDADRTRVIAIRSILSSFTVAVLTLGAGKWLEAAQNISWAHFPANYQVVYFVGFAASMVSMYYLLKIRIPPSPVLHKAAGVPGTSILAGLRDMLRENPDFARLLTNTFIFDWGAWLVGPLYIIFFVRQLNATDGWIGLNTTLSNLGVMVGYYLWRRWMRKLGSRRTLLLTAPLCACYAVLVALVPRLTPILLFGILINLINPGISMGHFNILLKLCPAERRASYLAVFNTIENAGAFVAPMIGVALSNFVGIPAVLLIGGGIRFLGALLFYFRPVQVEEGRIN